MVHVLVVPVVLGALALAILVASTGSASGIRSTGGTRTSSTSRTRSTSSTSTSSTSG